MLAQKDWHLLAKASFAHVCLGDSLPFLLVVPSHPVWVFSSVVDLEILSTPLNVTLLAGIHFAV